jgi:hypothetical protein
MYVPEVLDCHEQFVAELVSDAHADARMVMVLGEDLHVCERTADDAVDVHDGRHVNVVWQREKYICVCVRDIRGNS